MNKKFPLISPSILSANPLHLQAGVNSIVNSGADMIHIDVMDGHFVPNLTFGLPLIEALKKSQKLPLDVHIMVSNPDDVALQYAKAGADYLTFHLEASQNPHALIKQLHQAKIKVGISIKPKTPVDRLETYLSDIDLVLMMSVEPGFGGQVFQPEVFKKLDELSELQQRIRCPHLLVSVDGGVSTSNVRELIHHGANTFVVGSAFFREETEAKKKIFIEKMKEASIAGEAPAKAT